MPKGTNATIDFDRTYHSKFDGDYVILKEVKSNTKGSREVLIKWIDTGNTQVVPLQNAIHEALRDKTKRQINFDKVYQSRSFGPFKILSRAERNSKSNHIMVNIQFINTGTITTVRYCDVLEGNVRDDYMPHVCGVGCIGKASSYHPAYNIWNDMITRCYNKNDDHYSSYGGKGVTVCDRWKCFEYFLEDLPLIDGYNNWLNNRRVYHLDKDLKQIGKPYNEKVYSLETCCFLHRSDNCRLASIDKKNRINGTNMMCKITNPNKL